MQNSPETAHLSTQYFMFRHALPKHGKEKGSYGLEFFSAHISGYGRETTQHLANHLQEISNREKFRFDALYQSPIRRCRETAEIVSDEIGLPPITDIRLMDRILEPEILVRRRIESFLGHVRQASYEHVVICTHQKILSGLESILTQPDHFTLGNKYPTGTLTIIRADRIVEVKDFNTEI